MTIDARRTGPTSECSRANLELHEMTAYLGGAKGNVVPKWSTNSLFGKRRVASSRTESDSGTTPISLLRNSKFLLYPASRGQYLVGPSRNMFGFG